MTGKQRSQGFEIGLTGRLFPGLNIFSGYTYLDTEILKDTTAAIVGNEIANVAEAQRERLDHLRLSGKMADRRRPELCRQPVLQ